MNEARALQRGGPGDYEGRGRGVDRLGMGAAGSVCTETPRVLISSVAVVPMAGLSHGSTQRKVAGKACLGVVLQTLDLSLG